MTEKEPQATTTPTGTRKQGLDSRKLAVEILIKIEKDAAYANLALNAGFKRKALSERDRAFVTALVQGVMRNRMHIDERIASFSRQPLNKLSRPLLNVLRVAVFQLEDMPDIPPSAVLDTSNELARSTGHKGHVKFANGLLRNLLRGKEVQIASREDDTPEDSATRLSIDYSVPEWIVRRWLANFGDEETGKLLEFAQSTPPIVLRTSLMSISEEGLENILKAKGIECHRGHLVRSCLVIDKKLRGSPEKIPGYKEGLFCIQDEAAAFVSCVVNPAKGDLIIDLCAAPGGKTLHLSELMENTGRVLAVDKSAARLNLLKKERLRLGLTNIELITHDGRNFVSDQPADKVLVDAPCTGTGVINRRSDLRYQREPADINSLTELQKELLAAAARNVKPGGHLIYSTCSLEPEENFDNIRWFLKEFQNFEGDDISHLLPASIAQELSAAWTGPACKTEPEMTRIYMIQLMPSRHGVSGFFIAKLRRKD